MGKLKYNIVLMSELRGIFPGALQEADKAGDDIQKIDIVQVGTKDVVIRRYNNKITFSVIDKSGKITSKASFKRWGSKPQTES